MSDRVSKSDDAPQPTGTNSHPQPPPTSLAAIARLLCLVLTTNQQYIFLQQAPPKRKMALDLSCVALNSRSRITQSRSS